MTAQTAMERLEAAMTDTITFRRASTTAPTYDDTTGDLTPVAPTEIYNGPCMVTEMRGRVPQPVEIGGEFETRTRYQVSIPRDSPTIHVGDLGTVDDSADPALAGALLTVTAVGAGSLAARRRLTCEISTVGPQRQ